MKNKDVRGEDELVGYQGKNHRERNQGQKGWLLFLRGQHDDSVLGDIVDPSTSWTTYCSTLREAHLCTNSHEIPITVTIILNKVPSLEVHRKWFGPCNQTRRTSIFIALWREMGLAILVDSHLAVFQMNRAELQNFIRPTMTVTCI